MLGLEACTTTLGLVSVVLGMELGYPNYTLIVSHSTWESSDLSWRGSVQWRVDQDMSVLYWVRGGGGGRIFVLSTLCYFYQCNIYLLLPFATWLTD